MSSITRLTSLKSLIMVDTINLSIKLMQPGQSPPFIVNMSKRSQYTSQLITNRLTISKLTHLNIIRRVINQFITHLPLYINQLINQLIMLRHLNIDQVTQSKLVIVPTNPMITANRW